MSRSTATTGASSVAAHQQQGTPAAGDRCAASRRPGFRAWPAASVYYDGTWAIRLTAGHPAKRLNSVNPLDPGDVANPAERIARAARRFAAYGRPLTFRMSPLSGNALSSYLDSEGWSSFAESLVMRLDLEKAALDEAIDQIPLKDIGRFVTAALAVHGADPAIRPGLSEIIGIDRSRGRAVRARERRQGAGQRDLRA